MSLLSYDACGPVALISEAIRLCPELCNLSAFLALCQTSKQLRIQCCQFFDHPKLLRQLLLRAVLDVVEGHTDNVHDIRALLSMCCEAWGPTALAAHLDLQKALIAAKDKFPLAKLLVQAGACFTKEFVVAAALANNPGPPKWVQACSLLGLATSLPQHITSYCLDGMYPPQPQDLTADNLFSLTAIALVMNPQEPTDVGYFADFDMFAFLDEPQAQALSPDQVKQLMQLILMRCKSREAPIFIFCIPSASYQLQNTSQTQTRSSWWKPVL